MYIGGLIKTDLEKHVPVPGKNDADGGRVL